MSLPPNLRDRVLAAARAAPAPSKAELARKQAIALLLGLLPAVYVLARGVDLVRRPVGYVVAVAAGFALVAVAATWGALARGRSMVGRPSAWLLVVACVTPAVLVAMAMLGYLPSPNAVDIDCMRVGDPKCFGITLAVAMGPLLAFAYARRGSDPVHPVLTGAALGAASGAWAGIVIALHCPYTSPTHVLLGHVLPTAVAALVGAVVGARVVAVRARSKV